MVLHEATAVELATHRVGNGDWIAGIGSGWRVHSAATATFDQFDDGRQALLAWARLHATLGPMLSPARCIVLAEAARATWRLWQIVKLAPSLRAWLVDSSDEDAGELLARLAHAAATLGDAYARCSDARLVPTLDTIGLGERGAQFVALMPGPHAPPIARPSDPAAPIARELARLLASELVERRGELASVIDVAQFASSSWTEVVRAAISG